MKRGSLGRFTWAVLVILLLLAMTGGAGAADGCPQSNNGQHNPVREEIKEPTCTEPGERTYYCTLCGQIITERKDPLQHSWNEGIVTTPATCTAEGVKTYTCTRCQTTRTESIPATGHIPETVPGRAATCTEAGLTDGSRCAVCGTVLSAQTEIPATGHTPETIPGRAATCTEAGLTDGSRCAVCGTVLSAQTEIPATGHSWDGGAVTTAPTCTANGTRTYTCTRCGAAYTESIPAMGHTPEVIPASAPTCAAPGKTEGSRCSVCGTILTAQADIPALAHQWGSWYTDRAATCTEHGQEFSTCLKCGAVRWQDISPLGHEWDEGTVIREAGYLEEGEITYTCLRDESHTKTEAIPVKERPENISVMNLMRGGSAPIPDEEEGAGPIFVCHIGIPLIIAVQPEGGLIDRENGSTELRVEAAGGTEPYFYEWHRKNSILSDGSGGLAEFLISRWGSEMFKKAEEQNRKAAQAVSTVVQAQPEASATKAEESGISAVQWLPVDFSDVVGDDRPTFTANDSGDYYCVVTDADGQIAVSETVRVDYKLYIAEQPKNMNLYEKDQVTFECRASGGELFDTGTYIYAWYDAEGNQVSFSDQGRTIKTRLLVY